MFEAILLILLHSGTPGTGTPVEDRDPILKFLRGASRPKIQLGVGILSEIDFKTFQLQISHGKSFLLTVRIKLAFSFI